MSQGEDLKETNQKEKDRGTQDKVQKANPCTGNWP